MRSNLGAMISSEVQRTLVKSPPELWAELSDPVALARHLGELGEIRIVRTEPESKVEWAAEHTTGTVSIKPSGWGTKVTLSVTRETAEAQPAPPDAVSEPPSEPAAGAEPEAADPEATAEPEATTQPQASAATEPEAADHAPAAGLEAAEEAEATVEPEVEPEPRRGLFSRLFGRRRRASQPAPEAADAMKATNEQPDAPTPPGASEPDPEQPAAFAAIAQALAPEAFATADPFAGALAAKPLVATIAAKPLDGDDADADGAREIDDLSAELMAAEDVTAEQVSAEEVTAVLTAVLDRLGAAHHRPFSRS
jgi:hypothetical protein